MCGAGQQSRVGHIGQPSDDDIMKQFIDTCPKCGDADIRGFDREKGELCCRTCGVYYTLTPVLVSGGSSESELERQNKVMREALSAIVRHQTTVGGGLSGFSLTKNIASKALKECGE
jgi:uncharacterized membrane protein